MKLSGFISKNHLTRREVHLLVKALIEEKRGDEIEQILLDKGMSPCVAREWGNEPKRRKALLARNCARQDRKEFSAFGKRGDWGRRIIVTETIQGRRIECHATKGYRSYQDTDAL